MTFNSHKVRGKMHCDIIVFYKKCSAHNSIPQLSNSNLTNAWGKLCCNSSFRPLSNLLPNTLK